MALFNGMLKFKKPLPNNYTVELKELSTKSFIPYLYHYNPSTIVTKRNDLLSVIKVEGFSSETADDEEIDIKKDMRNNLFKGMANSNLSIWVHTIRRRYGVFPDGIFKEYFADILNEEWRKKHDSKSTFVNEHYITVVRKAPGKVNITENFLDNIFGSSSTAENEGDMNYYDKALIEAYNELEEIRDRVINGLNSYRPHLLTVVSTSEGTFSQPLEFLSYLVNCGYHQRVAVSNNEVDRYINSQRLYFDSKTIEAAGANHHKYGAMVSLKEYRPSTQAGILDGFLALPFEFIISQSFSFIDRASAIAKMQLQQRRLMQSQDVAITQIQEIGEALDSAMGGMFAFGQHHLSVLCLADNTKELDSNVSQCVVEFANIGVAAVREKLNMECAFWSQLPANYDFVIRKSTINTLNLSGYASFHNLPSGKAKGNHWGNAVTILQTSSGTPYFFSFHTRDVGHTMIIGPTGAGKTVLLNFLLAQALKFSPNVFFFDKDLGAKASLLAINGVYTIIDPGERCGLNPFQLPDTPDNRVFLNDFIKILISVNGEAIAPEESNKISTVVDSCYRLEKRDRKLSNIAPFFGIETAGSIATRLSMWYGKGSKARVFDNDEDSIDFSISKIFGFEMAKILKDKTIISPVLFYLFHRINISLTGKPTMIILDEAWALIDNPVFAPRIKDWLKVLRKLNAFVVFATQSVEDATKSSISDTLVQQTATQIFLPNLKATDLYRSVFMLSSREHYLIKHIDPSSRFFLVKQDNSGVVARVDLRGMTDAINVLSGRTETVAILDEIRASYGTQPEQWIPRYLEAVRKL